MMTVGGRGHRDFGPGMSWLWLIALLCLSGRCIGHPYDGFGYQVSGATITITNYSGSGGAVTIPSSIPGVDGTVTAIGIDAFAECSGLSGVSIPSSVTAIGDGAFYWCSGLTSVIMGNGVTAIGGYAFYFCSGLTSVTIPDSVTAIGDGAFAGCGDLTSVTIGNGVTNLGESAFASCSGLTDVTVPNSVTYIGADAFYGCSGLTSVTIGNGVTDIRREAFAYCSHLTGACFQGDGPSGFGADVFLGMAPGFLIYYPSTAAGWSTPAWNGYRAQQYPFLTLVPGPGAVTPSFNYLLLGTNYQLQVSADLSSWRNTGPVFTATAASAAYPQPFNVSGWNHLFFRLASAP
jgi:hypothetical protein